ncbi:hypothetical protein FBUS_02338 [Fasciolopsis buskii]|uniref:Uncharacterized protein n=1 Tax=Fasciolopsis buskii TaxID=27845 RepID=A0A8E0RVC0_9TREM|nr:hypothetical protein FBUS_02338 [Fasciolopsis buski]
MTTITVVIILIVLNFRFPLLRQVEAEILHNITAFTKHASVQVIEQFFVPILCDCLESNVPDVQIIAMQSLHEMSGYFQQNELDDIVLPGVLQAYTKSAKNKAVQGQVLRTLTTLVRQISVSAVQEHLVPFLLQITKQQPTSKSAERLSPVSGEKSTNNGKSTVGGAVSNQISTICEIWKNVIATRSEILEPNQVTREIFPSILPQVLNKDLNVQEIDNPSFPLKCDWITLFALFQPNCTGQFRSVMSTLYALLDYLDLPMAGSEDSVDTANYRIIPALTIDAPNSEEPQDIPLGESPPCFT